MRSIFARPSGWHYSSPFGIKPDLHHALLSAKLGGGIAYMGVICDSDYGFGLSGSLSGRYRSMGNDVIWDMMVVRNRLRQYQIMKRLNLMCLIKQITVSSIIDPISVQFTHELGHNFNSGHTHDRGYSPRIDTCGCSYSGGQCTDLCSSQLPLAKNATIMSYCQLCSGGCQNLDYTFGGKYVSGSRSDKNSYSNSTLAGTVSTEPRRVNARMYTHVSMRGTCTQPNNTGVSIVLNTINLFSCLPSLKFTLSFAIPPPTTLKPALSALDEQTHEKAQSRSHTQSNNHQALNKETHHCQWKPHLTSHAQANAETLDKQTRHYHRKANPTSHAQTNPQASTKIPTAKASCTLDLKKKT